MHIASCRLKCRSVTAFPGGRQRVLFRREAGETPAHAPMLPAVEASAERGVTPADVGGDLDFIFTAPSLVGSFTPGAVYTLRLHRGEEEFPA